MPHPARAARGYSFQGGVSHPFLGRSGEVRVLETFGLGAVLTVLGALALLAWLAVRPAVPPRPLDGATAAGAFASARALPALRQLSLAPRPVASAANARARGYIVQRLRSMDLEPEVQTATAQRISGGAAGAVKVSLGVVNNVLVRIKGTVSGGPALLLASHYDSLATRPGGDGAAPAAAMLETLRALQHGAPLANDVIFLFADAGKTGALGARAFAGQHRWARDVGVVLQFDAAGHNGPLLLTSTRGGNGTVVAGWLAAAPLALGSSAFEVLARAAPTLPVQGPLDDIGEAGLRFASIEDRAGHSADAGLQHMGETMLALTRHFGATPLAGAGSADSVHFELPLAGHVQYSSERVWAVTRLVCFLFVLACCMAVRYLGLEPQMLVAGAMAFVMLVLALASIAITLWHSWPGLDAGYSPLDAGTRDRCYLLAYVTLGSALFVELQRLMHKALGTPAVTLGALMVLLAALLGASWLLPAASYLLAWPLMTALLAYGLLHLPPVAAWPQAARLALMVAAAVPAVVLIAPLLQQVAIVFTPQRSALLMIVLSVLLGLCTPLLAAVRRRFVAPLLLCVCVAAIVGAGNTAPDRPAPARAAAQLTGPAIRVPYPELFALRDADDGRRRRIAFSLRSHSGAPAIEVRVEGGDILRAALNGQLLTDGMARSWNMNLYGSGARRHRIELELPSGSTARVRIAERIPGLEGGTDTLVFR